MFVWTLKFRMNCYEKIYNSIKQLTTVICCYILFVKGEQYMHIIVNHSSMTPIYEQIVEQIKTGIVNGALEEGMILPSVRNLSKELKISALTVKKAYDNLETEGFTVTVHGKGTFVAATNTQILKEEQIKEVEKDLEQVISKGKRYGLEDKEIRELFDMIMEE